MGNDPENHLECILEVCNNTSDVVRFQSDDLSSETWDGDTDYEWRYGDDYEPEEMQTNQQTWQTFLSWVVNATPETFVSEFEDHCIKDNVLFYYLFTEIYTMVDNRAKNTFWHTRDGIHWDLCFDYDNDTAMGNNNRGDLTLTYGLEDTDSLGGGMVFNAADSKFFCYIRDYMKSDLEAMYRQIENLGGWSTDRVINKFDEWQNCFPERLWMADVQRKYFRPYEDNGTTDYLEGMMFGRKRYQRRQFLRYQEKYMSSKYMGSVCTADRIYMRGYTPSTWSGIEPNGDLTLTPYADMYIACMFGSYITRFRAKRGQEYLVENAVDSMNDTEMYVYTASQIQSMGDVSAAYIGLCDIGYAEKLQELIVGSDAEGYVNENLKTFSVGNNALLEYLNLQNLPNLVQTVNFTACQNLEEFYAEGSGITGVQFAPGGKLRVAHLPAIANLSAKNLAFLDDLQIESLDNMTTLIVENCDTIDTLDMVDKAKNLTRVRLIGIDWNTDDTTLNYLLTLGGVDETGYNTATSVLSGTAHIPVARQQTLDQYAAAWPDLDVTYDTLMTQYKVTFVNDDKEHTVLDVQYVDMGASAVDPVTREDNPIPTPTKESTVSTDYTYNGWDGSLAGVFSDRTLTATYTESVRQYTIKYVSRGSTLKEIKAPYGSTVDYDGETPVYTGEESAFRYYLFKRWDTSGLVTGDKTINAVFDTCEYTSAYFDDKELHDLTPVELYACMKLELETSLFEVKDYIELPFGMDYSYDDIEEHEAVSATTAFDGSNKIDTGIKIMEIDRAFTVAIDFEFASENTTGGVLAQCYQSDGSNGFRLWYNNGPRFSWGTDSLTPSSNTNREMLILRHPAGSNQVYIYLSNLNGTTVTTQTLTSTRNPVIESTLVFGCAKADDGLYENYAKGSVHWCKVWYADLGENVCKDLASWVHETIPMELAKFKGYYLSDVASKRAAMTFLGANVLSVRKVFSNQSTNAGGWADSTLATWMNTRLLNAVDAQWRSLIKPVKVTSSIGGRSTETSQSNCYFFAPSIYEMDSSMATDPYINETNAPISYLINDTTRIRTRVSDPEHPSDYWTRSPNVSFTNYIYTINTEGSNYGFSYPSYESGILPMFSIGVD